MNLVHAVETDLSLRNGLLMIDQALAMALCLRIPSRQTLHKAKNIRKEWSWAIQPQLMLLRKNPLQGMCHEKVLIPVRLTKIISSNQTKHEKSLCHMPLLKQSHIRRV